uniref:Photolyase/cryptochrome alpha/beta domain-containing protein n=1 Tax=Chenopodium quinoa TaxID=63459 RepID=A0A803LYT1_CHEQI
MYTLRNSSLSILSLQKFTNSSKPTSIFINFTQNHFSKQFYAMNSASNSENIPPKPPQKSVIYRVPALETNDIDKITGQIFQRYYLSSENKRNGKGVCIIWFRNDLRVLDNEALFKAWASSEVVLPVYCVDPRHFGTTYSFGFPKTGADLRKNLQKHGLNLLVKHGKPEDIIPALAETFGAHTIYAQKETCSEELNVEVRVNKGLQKVSLPSTVSTAQNAAKSPKLQLLWGATLYYKTDLPFDVRDIPDVYTQFRKSIESKSKIRACVKIPSSLGPPPEIEDWGAIPSIDQLGLHNQEVDKGLVFIGGESASLSRVHEYFWKQVKRYERERIANDSTYWVLFELIWRDYFRFISIKYGNSIFHLGGPRHLANKWSQDTALFESWRDGKTGYPLIDANMKELATTGFMSNRGRQIVCSFLVRDMGIDWRMGAEWFETCLLDYDPCSNYGNWTYGAGVGNDPREDRYFSIPKQAQVYDPEGEYVAYWLPELRRLPKDKRHFPGFSYLKPIVPLKFGNTGKQGGQKAGPSRRDNRTGGPRNKHFTR